MAARALDEKLSVIDARRSRTKPRAPRSGKGRPPLRECPQDFDTMFVEIGRLDCEVIYRAARITIDRWLLERGKERLIKMRADYVRHQRNLAKKAKPEQHIERPKRSRRKISHCLASAAADWLRKPRNGGWRVSRTAQGDYWVGIARRSTDQLLDLAVSRGFDVKEARAFCRLSEEMLEPERQSPGSVRHSVRSGTSQQRSEYYASLLARFKSERLNVQRGIGSDWQEDFGDV